MSQNKNTPYYIGSHYIVNEGGFNNGLSIFNLLNSNEFLEQEQRRNSFNAFIESRNCYLTRLHGLGDNWMSGSSKQPTEQSINLSKEIINELGNWYNNEGYKKHIYPKIIMSPTPVGGVAMEIEMSPNIRAYLSILDNDIDYGFEKDGFFVEQKLDRDAVNNQLLTLYNSHERGYYSKW